MFNRNGCDTISHSSLLNKLPSYGVTGKELEWFKSYLFNRQQFVRYEKKVSDPNPVLCGVPQGSILGPLLFLVFFNDFETCLQQCDVITFADDTVVYKPGTTSEEIEAKINQEIKNIKKYFEENELIVNLKKNKTEAMLLSINKKLSNTSPLSLKYGDRIINNTTKYKYLSITIDPTENFNKNYKKAASRLRLLSFIRQSLTPNVTAMVYNTMIRPTITYNFTTNLNITETQKKRLESLDKRAEKITNCGIKRNNIKIESSFQVTRRYACCFVKKCLLNHHANEIFDSYFRAVDHSMNTRNNNKLVKLPRVKLETARSGFYYMGARLYNTLPIEIRSIKTFSSFKKQVKKFNFTI